MFSAGAGAPCLHCSAFCTGAGLFSAGGDCCAGRGRTVRQPPAESAERGRRRERPLTAQASRVAPTAASGTPARKASERGRPPPRGRGGAGQRRATRARWADQFSTPVTALPVTGAVALAVLFLVRGPRRWQADRSTRWPGLHVLRPSYFVFVYRVEARKSAKWCAGLVRMCRYVQYGSRGRQTGRFEGARARG